MDYSSYSNEDAGIFLDIINKVRNESGYIELDATFFLEQTNEYGGAIYVNEIEWIYEGVPYCWEFFKILKTELEFTTSEHTIFKTIIEDYYNEEYDVNENPYINYYLNYIVKNQTPIEYDYTEEQINNFFNVYNQERAKRGLDPVIVPPEIPPEYKDAIEWFFDYEVYQLAEFNSKDDIEKIVTKQIRVWAITHIIPPEGLDERPEGIVIGVFTNKEEALLNLESVRELNENDWFDINELVLGEEIPLYINPPSPDWYTEIFEE